MKKKSVFFVLVALLMVSFVSAFFHLEEPRFEPFDATVDVSNAPPTIVKFLSSGSVQPIVGTTVTANLFFVAEDVNGPSDLPGLTGPAISAGNGVSDNLLAVFASPINAVPGSGVARIASTCTAVECASGTNPNCNTGNFINQKQYDCDITMNYYDAPALSNTVADDMWTLSVVIEDVSGAIGGAVSGDPGFANVPNDYMEYLTVSGLSVSGTISWSSLDIDAVDQPAASSLLMSNLGNVALSTVTVTGADLIGVNNPAATMGVAAFSAGDALGGQGSGACDVPTNAVALVDGVAITVTGSTVPYAALASTDPFSQDNMYFCVDQAVNPTYLSGGFDTQYAATTLGGNNWEALFI